MSYLVIAFLQRCRWEGVPFDTLRTGFPKESPSWHKNQLNRPFQATGDCFLTECFAIVGKCAHIATTCRREVNNFSKSRNAPADLAIRHSESVIYWIYDPYAVGFLKKPAMIWEIVWGCLNRVRLFLLMLSRLYGFTYSFPTVEQLQSQVTFIPYASPLTIPSPWTWMACIHAR